MEKQSTRFSIQCSLWPAGAICLTKTTSGSWSLGKHSVNNYSHRSPPIKLCGRLCFAFFMHDVVVCVGGSRASVLIGTCAAENSGAIALATRAPPCRSRGVDVVRVGVAWIRSARTSRQPAASSGQVSVEIGARLQVGVDSVIRSSSDTEFTAVVVAKDTISRAREDPAPALRKEVRECHPAPDMAPRSLVTGWRRDCTHMTIRLAATS
jgi:hypothetical protein